MVLFAWFAVVAAAGPASAHADLVRSDPAAGSVLKAEPGRVALFFSEEVTTRLGTSVRVIGPDGRQLAGTRSAPPGASPPAVDTATLTVTLAPDRAQGTFAVVWHAVAADDGHLTEGVVMFSVGHPSALTAGAAGAGAGSGRPDRVLSAILDAATWLSFLGFALLIGPFTLRIAAFPTGSRPLRATAPAPAGWLLLSVATLAQFLGYGPYASGGSWGEAFDRTLIGDTLGTRTGHALALRAMLLMVSAIAGDWLLSRISRAGSGSGSDRGPEAARVPVVSVVAAVTSAAVAVGLALTWSATSHAADGSRGELAIAVTTLHVLAMGVWLGGLISLLMAIRAEPDAAPVHAFSRVAIGAVTVLAATGAYQAWREIGSVNALFASGYGRLLLVKVGLLALILLAAAKSRTIVRGAARATGAPDRTVLPDRTALLGRTVLLEGVGVTVLLLLTTLLIGSAPPR